MTDVSKIMADFAASHIAPKRLKLLTHLTENNLEAVAFELNQWGVGGTYFHYEHNGDQQSIDFYTYPGFEPSYKFGSIVYEKNQFCYIALYSNYPKISPSYYIHHPGEDPQITLGKLTDGLMAIRAPNGESNQIHILQHNFEWEDEIPKSPRLV